MPRMDVNHPRGKYVPGYLTGEGKIAAIKRVRSTHPNYLGLAEAKALVDSWGTPPLDTARSQWGGGFTPQRGIAPQQAVLRDSDYFDGGLVNQSWIGAAENNSDLSIPTGNTNVNGDQTAALMEELSNTARRYRDAYEDLERRFEEYRSRMEGIEAKRAEEFRRVCDERDSLALELTEALQ